VDATAQRIENAEGPTYTQLYYPGVDSAAHKHGPAAAAVRAEVDLLEREIERLAAALGPRARIVVSADHGLIEAPDAAKVLFPPEGDLAELLVTPPSGESRVPFFHCRPGRAAEFARRFRSALGDAFLLLTPDEVAASGLLGSVTLPAVTRSRLGDFVALAAGDQVLVHAPDREIAALKGFHGGLSADEVRVPLIVA
jgi:hypothetical protein